MNLLENNTSFYSNYFKGIQDVAQHKSIKQTGLGLLKIASYPTLFIPIIFGVGYLIAKSKMNQLSSLIDRVSDSLKPGFSGSKPTQNEYITFLATKILDGENAQTTTDALEHVQTDKDAFKKLEPDSQIAFFASMARKEKIQEAIDSLPKDLTEVYLPSLFGKEIFMCPFHHFMKALHHFNSLEKIVRDLPGERFSKKVEKRLNKLLKLNRSYNIVSYFHRHGNGVAHVFEMSILELKSQTQIKSIEIRFSDHKVTLAKKANSEVYIERIVGQRVNIANPIQ